MRTGDRIVKRIRRKFPEIGVKWAETIPGDRRHLRLYTSSPRMAPARWLFDLATWTAVIEAMGWGGDDVTPEVVRYPRDR